MNSSPVVLKLHKTFILHCFYFAFQRLPPSLPRHASNLNKNDDDPYYQLTHSLRMVISYLEILLFINIMNRISYLCFLQVNVNEFCSQTWLIQTDKHLFVDNLSYIYSFLKICFSLFLFLYCPVFDNDYLKNRFLYRLFSCTQHIKTSEKNTSMNFSSLYSIYEC